MPLSKGYKYSGQEVNCPICDQECKTPQGLGGHLRNAHGIIGEDARAIVRGDLPGSQENSSSPIPTIPPGSSEDIKELQRDVIKLQLLKKRQELSGIAAPPREPDISQELGLGALTNETRQELQGRAFGTKQQEEKSAAWWHEIARKATLGELLGLVRGALGVQGGSGVQGISEVLNLLGFSNIQGLVGRLQPTVATAPEAFDLPDGTRIPKNFPLEPNLLKMVMTGKSGDPMSNALSSSLERLMPVLQEWVSTKQWERGAIASGEPEQKITEIACPECGTTRVVDISTARAGEVFNFECPNADCKFTEELIYDDARASPKHQRKIRKVQVKQPERELVSCPECGQSIDVSGREILTEVECGACGEQFKLTKPDIPIEPLEPKKE